MPTKTKIVRPKEHQRVEFIAVDKLHFDPENPRLPSTINKTDERAVLDWMLRHENIAELMGAIAEEGYFPGEPLLVTHKNGSPGEYEVIEGNRRLTAVKLLLKPELAPARNNTVRLLSSEAKNKPIELPVLVYNDPQEILKFLGFRHITGIRSWDPLQKAKFLKRLQDSTYTDVDSKNVYKQLARNIGSRSDYVRDLLVGYAVYERIAENDFFDINGLNEETIDFSVLTTAFGYSSISQFVGLNDSPKLETLDEDNLKSLTAWLFERNAEGKTRLGDSRNLKYLSGILENPKAVAAFNNGTPLFEAHIYTESPTAQYRTSVVATKTQLETANQYVHRAMELGSNDLEDLKEISILVRDLRRIVEGRISDAEED